ncbi:hypothetical protein HBI68_111730 [Parastagonospora nodorum]|nr:hypothetical protein HBI68_111730 [Parastagonospora nodorum]
MADKNAKSGWTDREILVCLLNVMEYSNCKLEYGRELKGEFESIKAGNPVDSTPKKKTADATPKSTPRKRKAAAEEDGEETPKKRGRPKKWAAKSKEPVEAEAETVVKDELDNHLGAGFEAEIVEQV